jgi:hypothetical protein
MAQQFQIVMLGEGGRVDHTPESAVAAGAPIITNGMFQFATQPIAAAALGTLQKLRGLRVRAVKITGAIAVGNDVYWAAAGDPVGGTAGTGAATTTAAGNTLMGKCVAAAASGDETVDVDLGPVSGSAGGVQNELTDPGDAGALPVTSSGRIALVSAGAETRTLAAPAAAGLELLIYMKTDGGDVVITAATAFNEAGNTTATFDNVGETLRLTSVEEGANLRWRGAVADGVTLGP